MTKAAIAIDDWKLEIFGRHLKEGGFKYEITNGVTPDTLLLCVETEEVDALNSTVVQAQTEASRTGPPKTKRWKH